MNIMIFNLKKLITVKYYTSGKNTIKRLNEDLNALTNELAKTTEQLEILKINNSYISYDEKQNIMKNQEIVSDLVKKQNIISRQIIETRHHIKEKSNMIMLKTELFILSAVFLLVFYIIIKF